MRITPKNLADALIRRPVATTLFQHSATTLFKHHQSSKPAPFLDQDENLALAELMSNVVAPAAVKLMTDGIVGKQQLAEISVINLIDGLVQFYGEDTAEEILDVSLTANALRKYADWICRTPILLRPFFWALERWSDVSPRKAIHHELYQFAEILDEVYEDLAEED